MGVDGKGLKVIRGKDTNGTTDPSHTERKEIGSRKIPSAPEEREIPVSCNLELFPVIITKLIAKIWQCRNIAQQKSDEAGNASSQMIRQVVNTLPE